MGKILTKSHKHREKHDREKHQVTTENVPETAGSENVINRESVSAMAYIEASLYCGDQAGVISKFDVNNENLMDSWSTHSKAITQIQCIDNKTIFTSSRDKNVCKQMIGSLNSPQTMSGHRLAVTALAMKEDGSKVISGGRDCVVVLWDSVTATEQNRLEVARNIVTDITWVGDSTQIVQCSEDKTMKLLDTRTMTVSSTFPIKQYFQSCCDVDADGLQVVTGSVGGNANGCCVTIWDIRQQKELAVMKGHQQNINSVQYFKSSAGVARIISISSDCYVRIWDPIKEVCTCSLYICGAQSLTCLASLDNDIILVGTLQGTIYKLQYEAATEQLHQISFF